MSKQITSPKTIQTKSRKHQVTRTCGNQYQVTSGASGNSYAVTVRQSGATCTCTWGHYRPRVGGHRSGCSHVAAVYDHIAQEQGRTVSVWTELDQVARQHRPSQAIGDGVILTTRKAAA